MIHYFGALVALAVAALLATAWLGLAGGGERHVLAGLAAAILTVAAHSLLIVFMIVTGRILREATRHRALPPEFLSELNEFFREKRAYPAAIFGAFSIVAAGVLGNARTAFGVSPAVHMLAGVVALAVNLLVFTLELRALRDNQGLVDRAAAKLDALDRELDAGREPRADERPDAGSIARAGLIVGVSAWMPFLYWGVVEWRGDFSRASLHPWLEASIAGFAVWALARGRARGAPAPTDVPRYPDRSPESRSVREQEP